MVSTTSSVRSFYRQLCFGALGARGHCSHTLLAGGNHHFGAHVPDRIELYLGNLDGEIRIGHFHITTAAANRKFTVRRQLNKANPGNSLEDFAWFLVNAGVVG